EAWGPDAPDEAEPKVLARALHGSVRALWRPPLTTPRAPRWDPQHHEHPTPRPHAGAAPGAAHNESRRGARGPAQARPRPALARGDDARPAPTTPDVGATARAASAAGTAARASGAVPTPPPPPPPAPPPAPPPTVAAEVVDLDDVRPAPGPATPSDVAEDLGL